MASEFQITELRAMINEPTQEPYTDQFLGGMIDQHGLRPAASKLWSAKAASVAHLVTISEAGSSRQMSDLHKQYLTFADRFAQPEDGTGSGGLSAPRSRRIRRV